MKSFIIDRGGKVPSLTILRGPARDFIDYPRLEELIAARVSPKVAEISWAQLVEMAAGFYRGGSSLLKPEVEPGGGRTYENAFLNAAGLRR